jgi:hypothetical protein
MRPSALLGLGGPSWTPDCAVAKQPVYPAQTAPGACCSLRPVIPKDKRGRMSEKIQNDLIERIKRTNWNGDELNPILNQTLKARYTEELTHQEAGTVLRAVGMQIRQFEADHRVLRPRSS